jgi:hypothetical protein
LGRTQETKRLAEYVTNMADDLSIFINANEEIAILDEIERPVHRAVHLGKILCPNDHCVNNKDFFLENGIVHHYRIKHKQDFTSAERRESTRICNELHQEETKKSMETIFEYRRRKVRMVKNVNPAILIKQIHVCHCQL